MDHCRKSLLYKKVHELRFPASSESRTVHILHMFHNQSKKVLLDLVNHHTKWFQTSLLTVYQYYLHKYSYILPVNEGFFFR